MSGVTSVGTNVAIPPPPHHHHALRLMIYLVVMGTAIFWCYEDVQRRMSPQCVSEPPCQVTSGHECVMRVNGTAVVVYVNHYGAAGLATPTPTP